MNGKEALHYILTNIKFYEPKCDEDRQKNYEVVQALKKELDVLDAIKKSHIKDDPTYETISVWFNSTNDYAKIIRWLNEQK